VSVANGVFAVNLDFGSGFPGASRFLEIRVRPSGGGAFTTLTPRQPVTSSPYSIKSLNSENAVSAATATNFSGSLSGDVTGTQSSTIVTGIQNRTIAATPPTSGQVLKFNSAFNQWQPDADTCSSPCTAAIFNATQQYNISGGFSAGRVLSTPGQDNLFVGIGSGQFHTTGLSNTFVGRNAGYSNTSGDANSFFGYGAGSLQSTGNHNAFFGSGAGLNNGGDNNAFFGASTGAGNTSGNENSYFGANAGRGNSVGIRNSFFGYSAGMQSSSGSSNVIVGHLAGSETNLGAGNVFIGSNAGRRSSSSSSVFIGSSAGEDISGAGTVVIGSAAGRANVSGQLNMALGYQADFGSANLTNAIAIGAYSLVTQSNSLILGSIAGVANATSSVSVGIGTTAPLAPLHVVGPAIYTLPDNREVSIGTPSGESGLAIKGTTNRADVRFDGETLKLVTGIGTGPPLSNNGIVITKAGLVGIGTATPAATLDIAGGVRIGVLAGGGTESMCRVAFNQNIAQCGSSLRYKDEVVPFSSGLDLVRRLRPITFNWKNGGGHDLGLAAEEVAKVEPLLVTHNEKGEIEGVKYAQLNVILINAVKEQQKMIETLKRANARLTLRLSTVERKLRVRSLRK
jgi:hypothetical protein